MNNYLQLLDSPNIFAAGDVAKFGLKNRITRIPHYTEAINQGTFAGWNMMGKNVAYRTVPFFWTNIFKTRYSFTGFEKSGTEVVFKKDFDKDGNFVAFNCDPKFCYSVMTKGHDQETILVNQALRLGLPLSKESVLQESFFADLKKKIIQNQGSCFCEKDKHNNA